MIIAEAAPVPRPFALPFDVSAREVISILLLLVGIYLTSYYNYLLFHAAAELFSIFIAVTIAIIAFNCWQSIRNQYLLFIGVAYGFVGLLDVLHTLSYKGMPIFTDYDYYAPQFWVAARYLEAISMLLGFSFLGTERRVNLTLISGGFTLVTVGLVTSIVQFKTFPICFVAGKGLTPFKVISEYIICALMLANIGLLYWRRAHFDLRVYRLLLCAAVLVIGMELCFTLYVSDAMSDAFNKMGHVLKIGTFYLLYKAVVVTALRDPINLLFRELGKKEAELEGRVIERTTQLAESERRFRTLADTAPVLIWMAGEDKLCHWFNRVWLDFTGRTMDQEMGKGWAERVHPDDFRRCRDAYLEAFDARRAFTMEYRLRRNDGEYRWLIASGVPRFDDQAKFLGYLGSCVDITDRKLIETRLTSVVSEQRAILLSEVVGLVMLRERRMTWMNDAFARMLGYEQEELIGRPTRMLYADEGAYQSFRKEAYAAILAGRTFRTQTQYVRKDGSSGWYDISGVRAGQGSTDSIWAFVDITESKQRERKLQESERRLSRAEMIAHLGHWSYEVGSQAIEWSDELWHIYGRKPNSVALTYDTFTSWIRDDYRAFHHEKMREVLALKPGGTVGDFIYCLVRPDGEQRWVEVFLEPEFDQQGAPLRFFGVVEDITERRDLETDLRAAKDAAEAANVSKSRFLATMSHEIRTPMNGILGMAQMLLTPSLKDEDRQGYAKVILNSGQILLTLLNDILDLSKVEAGRFELANAPFEPEQILRETKALFEGSAKRNTLSIEAVWRGPPGICYRGDDHRLRQMLSNLAANATKFTAQGQIRVEGREVSRDERSAELEFAVVDTGVGIPEDQHGLLFQAFSQIDSSTTREHGGSGLGLAIVRSLAELMGGEVGVDSELGKGSRFWFRIRAGLVAPGEAAHHRDQAIGRWSALTDAPRQLSGKVLVVEDDATNRKVAEALLTKLGLTVEMAEDGQQALFALTGGSTAQLVLMDVQMPVMDGYAATEAIRQWEERDGRARRPIIALTADAFAEDRQRCLAVGMDDYLSKPIVLADLQELLGRWLPMSQVPAGPASAPRLAAVYPRHLDVRCITAILRQLEPMLERQQFDALAKFRELREAVRGSEAAKDIDELGPMLESFRFADAYEHLQGIALARGWGDSHP